MTNDNAPAGSQSELFDVRAFARTAHGSHRDQLDLSEFAETPLPPDTLRALRLLRGFEASTMAHLRNVLVTATHKDARVTAFLVTWAFEKFWIADALAGVLAAHAEASPTDDRNTVAGPRRHARAEASDRHGPIRRALTGFRVGTPIIAVHMTAGLVDDWVTGAAYARLAGSSDSSALTATVARILQIKARHSAFFSQEAERRLAGSERAVRLTAKALTSTAWPLGALTCSADERTFFETYTFGGSKGRSRAAEIERSIAALPGIDEVTAAAAIERLVP
ncbi:hypothetical protein [Humibacter antri]